MKKVIISTIALLILAGCADKSKIEPMVNRNQIFSYQKPDVKTPNFEQSLSLAAAKASQSWQHYYEMLESKSNLYDKNLRNHVPRGMGKLLTTKYSGYLSEFVKTLAEESGYVVYFKNLRPEDLGIITVDYYKTTIWDMLQMNMAKKNEYGMDIIENEEKIVIYPRF